MNNEPTSTLRARRLRERRSRGVVMVAPVEIGSGGVELLVSYARKLVTAISSGVFDLLDPVLERHSFDDVGEMA
jgi:hypothetical protein